MNCRTDILEGTIELPEQILELVGKEEELAKEMFQAIWYNYLKNKNPTNSTYWYDRFEDPKVFNQYVMHLSKSGWITSIVKPKRNWAEFHFNATKLDNYISKEEVEVIRYVQKFQKYVMTDEEHYNEDANLTKTSKGITDVGLVREGFQKSSHHNFKLDTDVMIKYRNGIVRNVIKGIETMNLDLDIAEYSNVAEGVIDAYIKHSNSSYCMNGSISDSRGRNIFKGLSKIFNPVGFKDARALLIVKPKSLGITGMKEVKLAVAELLGLKAKTKEALVIKAEKAIEKKTLPKVTDDTLWERIWVERIYNNLDIYNGNNWIVPIEIDFTASILAIEGLLLGDYNYLDLTNIVGDEIKDAWTIPGVSRKQVKACCTPTLYGSSETVRNLWEHRNLDYTEEQVTLINEELKNGRFKLARLFKDYIIKNVETSKKMTVKVWDDEFTIYPNRFRNVGDYVKKYNIYDSEENRVKSIRHTHTKRVPDLEQFKLYFPTLLAHGVDSQIANKIVAFLEWCIDVHDAFIVHPADANKVRSKAVSLMNEIHNYRDTILSDFFKSTGIELTTDWLEIRNNTVAKDSIRLTANVLK